MANRNRAGVFMPILEKTEMIVNAAGRSVPETVNGRPQAAYMGVGKYQPFGRKAAPPICSTADYPANGDKRVADLETALRDRKSTRLNSSHVAISYAVFCLKKKNKNTQQTLK